MAEKSSGYPAGIEKAAGEAEGEEYSSTVFLPWIMILL